MSQVKMQAARELIEEKRYEEARAILKTVDDPLAQKWLSKLNKTSPKRSNTPLWVTVVILLMGLALAGGFAIGRATAPKPSNSLVEVNSTLTAELQVVTTPSDLGTSFSPPPGSTDALAGVMTANPGVMVSVTPTAEAPTAIPTLAPTQDCGAGDWWNYAGVHVIDYFDNLQYAAGQLQQLQGQQISAADNKLLVLDIHADGMDDERKAFDQVQYPLCAKEAHDAIILAMYNYGFYVDNERFKLTGHPEDVLSGDPLGDARAGMRRAADAIRQLTEQDTEFMKMDSIG